MNLQSTTGPNSFVKRLADQLTKMGVEVVDESDGYDVALVTIEHTSRLDVTKPFVHRIDGLWFRPDDFYHRNNRIRDCYEHADAVIYQSYFDEKMVKKWFGEPRSSSVIHNGIDTSVKALEFSDAVLRIRDSHEKVFVCSSTWHPQKRLSDNIELYRKLRSVHPSSCLIVLGGGQFEMDRMCVRDEIYYTGPQTQDFCRQTFAASDWMIHTAWLDHCPNVVLESLSQETPVICSSSGGTHEIVGSNGIVIEDAAYGFELMDYNRPPIFPIPDVKTFDLSKKQIDMSSIDIRLCAEKYLDVLESVL